MPKYKIYAGLNGGFGGAEYQYTEEFSSQEDADKVAYEAACEIYDSYEGLHGLRSLYDIIEEEGVDMEEVKQIYIEDRESWMEYYAVLDDENEEIEEE